MLRKPCVSGQFYPASKLHLEKEVNGYLSTGLNPRDVVGVISPHAGYIYSGAVAGAVFSAVNVPDSVIVLSPNHTGIGTPASIMSDGEWEIPTGVVPIDAELSKSIMNDCPELRSDVTAHLQEHSLEVQLPFLLEKNRNLKIVPITFAHLRFDVCESIGKAIARTMKKQGGKILIVASSDMNHYESEDITNGKDERAIEKVLSLDAKGLLDVCGRERITMCGVVPSAIMLIAAKELGAKKAELIRHSTSGETSGDYDSVVGYAGMIVY